MMMQCHACTVLTTIFQEEENVMECTSAKDFAEHIANKVERYNPSILLPCMQSVLLDT